MPNEFWDLTLAEFEIKAEGYYHRQEREWEHTRFICAYLATSASKKVVSPEEIRPTIFDQERPNTKYPERPKLTKEDVAEFEKKWLNNSK